MKQKKKNKSIWRSLEDKFLKQDGEFASTTLKKSSVCTPLKGGGISSGAANKLYVIISVFLGLIFLCVYFDVSTSTFMVNTFVNSILVAVLLVIFLFTTIFYRMKRVLPTRFSFKLAVISLTAAIGFLLMPALFDHTAATFYLYGFAIVGIAAIYLKVKDKLNVRTIVLLIIIGGCIFRIGYGMAVPLSLNAHDYTFTEPLSEGFGHARYIGYILENLSLPDTNGYWQFYHPPLHHIISAVFFKGNQLLGFSFQRCAENLQFLTGMYSCVALVIWYKILLQFHLKKLALLIPLAIIAFHPSAAILGAGVNNDMLMWLLLSACLLYLVKWCYNPTMKNIVLMGLLLGLAMMSKASAVLLAPAITVVFLCKLCQAGTIFSKKWWKQFAAFGLISIPTGMWYSVRNYLLFGQSFGYVPTPGNETSNQYVGAYSLLERLIPFDLSTIAESPFVIWGKRDYNMFIKTFKTSLFGETTYLNGFEQGEALAHILSFCNYFLILISFAAIIYVLIKLPKNKSFIPYMTMAIFYGISGLSYVYFYISYPYQCTADIRYVALNIPIGALFIGKMYQMLRGKESGKTIKSKLSAAGRYLMDYTTVCTGCLCIFSILVFFLDSFIRNF